MDNINDIISSLTPDDINRLKETAQAIFGSNNEPQYADFNKKTNNQNDGFMNSGFFPDAEMLGKIGRIMSMMQSEGSDKRCDLIQALKPNLSLRRQHKADEAIQILKLLELLPLLSQLTDRGE